MAGLLSQSGILIGVAGQPKAIATTFGAQLAYGPPSARSASETTVGALIARSGGTTNVVANISQAAVYMAYKSSTPVTTRQTAWTFFLDGHRFYVLPLGPEGDWAYDTTTKEWCKFKTQGFDGLNFKNGVMWNFRIMGGDSLYPYLLEMDPNKTLDDDFRPIQHIVTGGLATRSRNSVAVANVMLTGGINASTAASSVTLAVSDDNGITYSSEYPPAIVDTASQSLMWNSMGAFSHPGRIFRITDVGGIARIDGLDVITTSGNATDDGIDQ